MVIHHKNIKIYISENKDQYHVPFREKDFFKRKNVGNVSIKFSYMDLRSTYTRKGVPFNEKLKALIDDHLHRNFFIHSDWPFSTIEFSQMVKTFGVSVEDLFQYLIGYYGLYKRMSLYLYCYGQIPYNNFMLVPNNILLHSKVYNIEPRFENGVDVNTLLVERWGQRPNR